MNKPTIKEVEDWVMTLYQTCEETITDAERKEQHKYATMVQRPQDKKFLVKMLDESCSPDIPLAMYQRAAEVNRYIATAAPVKQGRVELIHYIKEQSISYEYHRYGSGQDQELPIE